MKNVFVTGESGTIPLAMQRLVCDDNYDICIVNSQLDDKFNLRPWKHHQSFDAREPELDFLDKKLLSALDKDFQHVDCIVHSGAYVGTDFCETEPTLATETNVIGTYNIVNICNQYQIPLIYLSTTAIFDPNCYFVDCPINEHSMIGPRTIYGLTKYSGELIVKHMCETPYIIVRPVFGFGNYPDDLHSALTKLIYCVYYNAMFNDKFYLDILLDERKSKSYTRVENIADVVLLMIMREDLWGSNRNFGDYNVGENYTDALNWFDMFDIIADTFSDITHNDITRDHVFSLINSCVKFFPEKDYLHWHNIDSRHLDDAGLSLRTLKNYINLKDGILKTVKSVIANIDKKPYWMK